MTPNVDLAGSTALVTGGGRGVGRVLASALAAAGSHVGLIARSGPELDQSVTRIRDQGGVAHSAVADIRDPEATRSAVQKLRRQLGPVDLLINNAGIWGPVGPTWEVPEADWWHAVEINLRGVGLCSREVLPEMIERRQGRIVNITSRAGVYRWPWATAYSVSKAAVVKLTENLAEETGRHHVHVFSVDPGLLRIGLSDPAYAETASTDTPVGLMHSWVRREIAAGRGAEPEQAIEIVLRIAAGEADELSGRHISAHDDFEAMLSSGAGLREDDLHVLRVQRLPHESPV